MLNELKNLTLLRACEKLTLLTPDPLLRLPAAGRFSMTSVILGNPKYLFHPQNISAVKMLLY